MSKKVGTLDIETLGMTSDAVVYEVSLITAEVDEYYKVVDGAAIPKEWTGKLDILIQMLNNRAIEQGTLAFHFKNFKENTAQKILEGGHGPQAHPQAVLQHIADECSSLDELWINGTSFDPPILQHLNQMFRPDKPLWYFRIENDIRTIRSRLSLSEPGTSTAKHESIEDCRWNWSIIQKFGTYLSKVKFNQDFYDNWIKQMGQMPTAAQPLTPTPVTTVQLDPFLQDMSKGLTLTANPDMSLVTSLANPKPRDQEN